MRNDSSPRPCDAEQQTVSLRDRLEGDLGALPIATAIDRLQKEILERRVRKTFSGSANLEAKAAANEY
jgi:threonyl-tRNA synthetase